MMRNRFPRFPQKGRNLQNLHVIRPTVAAFTNADVKETTPAIIFEITPSTESVNHNSLKQKNTGAYEFIKNRRGKKRKRNYNKRSFVKKVNMNESNPSEEEPVVSPPQKANKTEKGAPENAAGENNVIETTAEENNTTETPAEENFFEEVEVASVEAEPKQETLVRFRKTKPCYMKYRKKGVFKPKFYKIGDPTFVNCMNMQEDVDVDIVSEAEYEYENDNMERSESQEMLNIIEIDDSEEIIDEATGDESSQDTIKISESGSTMRLYKTCIEENGDLTQGKCLIQTCLDSWNYHLIGLEYLIEIQNTTKDSALKYHCVLCLEDTMMEGFPGVINHINSFKHIVKYLEKHFPTFGYKFNENDTYNIIHLQKIAEEINQQFGYYFMCISDVEYFSKSFQIIEEMINKAYHPNEKDFLLDNNSLEQKMDSDFEEEIKNIINNSIEKVVLLQEGQSTSKSKQSALQISVQNTDSVEVVDITDDSDEVNAKSAAKIKKKKKCTIYKGNNALSSYMALSTFAKSALKKNGKKNSVTRNINDSAKKKEFHGGNTSEVARKTSSGIIEKVTCGKADIQHKAEKNIRQKAGEPVVHDTMETVVKETKEVVDHEIIEETEHEIIDDTDHEMEEVEHEIVEDAEHEIVEEADQEIMEEDQEVVEEEDQEVVEEEDQEIVEEADQEIVEEADQEIVEEADQEIEDASHEYEELVEDASLEPGEDNENIEVIDLAAIEEGDSVAVDSNTLTIETEKGDQQKDYSEAAVEVISDAVLKDPKTKGKVPLKISTVHSKYCRKRILAKESSRPRLSIQTSTKAVFSDVSKKCSTKRKTITKPTILDASEKNVEPNKGKVKLVKTVKSSTHKTSVHKSVSVQKSSLDAKSSLIKQSSSAKSSLIKQSSSHKTAHKKNDINSSMKQITVTKSTPSVWKPITNASSSLEPSTSSSTHAIKIPVKVTRNPVRRTVRRLSKSPAKRNKSPVKHVSRPLKSPTDKHSKSSRTSPVKRKSKSPIKRKSRSPVKRKSKSPVKRKSRSPLRHHVKSPLRQRSKSPLRSHIRSPLRQRSKSPVRSRIRSPLRQRSKSPLRPRNRSPLRQRSKSPFRSRNRSPLRQRSKSPLRSRIRSPLRLRSRSSSRHHSRSLSRRYSRSPLRLRSRSPLRRRSSRSPVRRRSRSPLRQHSRSPVRLRSRSPIRRRSRSPLRRRSRSPLRGRRSRSLLRHRSRSNSGHYSRSPLRRRSRTPVQKTSRKQSKSPLSQIIEKFEKYQSSQRVHSPDFGHSVNSQKHYSDERSSTNTYNFEKRLGSLSEFSKVNEVCKMLSSSKRKTGESYKSQSFSHSSAKGISDLDPVSDEDESLYFSDKNQRMDDTNSSKMMLAKLLQKFSMTGTNQNDPTLNKFLQFMEAQNCGIGVIGSQPKSDNIHAMKVDTGLQERNAFLQQYLLSSLAGSVQEPRLPSPVSTMPPKFEQPPFMSIHPGLRHTSNVPPPAIPHSVQQRFFPPNVNVPPPQIFHQMNQPQCQDFTPKPNVPPEVMFKDLKATVNKLFGANETAMKQGKSHMPSGYVTEPDPEKWDLNHPDIQKFNTTKNIYNPQGKNTEFSHIPQNPTMQENVSPYNNSNPSQGQFFGCRGGVTKSQISSMPIPPPDAKVSFCEVSRSSPKSNLFPVVNAHSNPSYNASSSHASNVNDVKVSLAQRLASVLVKVGMIDVPAPLLQEMLMKIGAFSSSPRQDISENEILSILKRLGYLS